jgi:alkylated DNA repair dioxygenase AlkB
VADLYRQSWTLEQAFNELTTHLRCELNTLVYPKAALVAFWVAAKQLQRTAALKGVLRGVHGEEKVERKVSNSYLSNEIQSMYGGTMVALPPTKWKKFQKMTTARLANQLLQWGGDTDLSRYPKHPRGPEKPKGKLPNARAKRVARTTTFVQKTAEATNDCLIERAAIQDT